MDGANETSATATVALVLSTAALLISILVWWSTLRDRRRQRQVAIGQKRTEILVAMQEIELALKPSIREVEMLAKTAHPASPTLQPALDGMISIIDTVQRRRNQLTNAILPGQSSHNFLLSLETLMAELHQQVKKAHAHRANVERMISELNKTPDSRP